MPFLASWPVSSALRLAGQQNPAAPLRIRKRFSEERQRQDSSKGPCPSRQHQRRPDESRQRLQPRILPDLPNRTLWRTRLLHESRLTRGRRQRKKKPHSSGSPKRRTPFHTRSPRQSFHPAPCYRGNRVELGC